MNGKTITILGATGFVGVNLASRLHDRGYNIKAPTRRKCRHNKLQVLSNIEVVEADTHNPAVLTELFKGSDAVINLVGILNEAGSNTHTFRRAHVDLVRSVMQACNDAGVKRYLHMSALNADAENGSSEYLRSKGEGEKLAFELAGDDIAVTAIRPSVIFGPNDSFFNRFAGLLELMPVFPLACPDSRMAPVFISDLITRMVEALEDPAAFGKTLDLVGPKDYSLRELVEFTAKMAGLERKIIDLPDWAARMQAKIMGLVPGKPFSMDNYLSLQTDSTSDDEDARLPTSIEAVVPKYLGHRNRNNKLQRFREVTRRQ